MPFKKGETANPGGRPKGLPGLAADCRKWADNFGIPFLKALIPNKTIDIRVRQAAAIYLIDRGYGKPTDRVELSGSLTLEQLVAESWKKDDPTASDK